MATNTTNFSLVKPAYTDTADIADINGNMDKVDVSLNGLADAIAIVANNNTHVAITAGQYVYVHGHDSLAEGLYTAKNNIAANAALSTSNLQADGSGGLNSVYSTLNSKIESSTSAELDVYGNRVKNVSSTDPVIVTKRGNVCVISGYIEYLVSPTSAQTSILTIPSGYMPVSNIYTTVARASDGKAFVAQISLSSGYINIYNRGEISTGDKFYLGITYVI